MASRIKTLHKAVSSSEPASIVIKMLEDLKKEPAPTEDQLRVSLVPFHPPFRGVDCSYRVSC